MNSSNLHTQQEAFRSQSSAATTRSPALNGSMERRPSLTQNHYRQGTKTHAQFQHSRKTSFVNSPATSPLSPYVPGANGPGNGSVPELSALTMHQHGTPELRPSNSPSSTTGSLLSVTSTLVGGQETPDSSNLNLTQRKMDRMGGNRARRAHSHHRSHSKPQGQGEIKTAYEHSLHHLFNSVRKPMRAVPFTLIFHAVHLTGRSQNRSVCCWCIRS